MGGWFLREALAALPLLVALSLWERGAVGPSARQMEGGRGGPGAMCGNLG